VIFRKDLPASGLSPQGSSGWLTRRRLLWGGCLLVPTAALLGTFTFRKSRQTVADMKRAAPAVAAHTQRAAQAAVAGHLERARDAATHALVLAPEHASALLVLACIALEEGDAREATSTLNRLKAAAPMRKEPLLLERLLAYRQQMPKATWAQAFSAAWTEAGRPDFEAHHLLAEMELEARDMQAVHELWRSTSAMDTRMMLALASRPMTSEQAHWLLQQVPALDDVALYLAVFNVLSQEALPETFLAQAMPVLRHRLSQLTETHPGSMQLRLLSQLAGTHEEAPFDNHDLTALSTISALPLWRENTLVETFLAARQAFLEAGLTNAGSWASPVAALTVADRGSLLLRKRAKATRRGLALSSRHSLGRVLSQVGARMAEESTLLERTLGLLMMQQGGEDQQDAMALAKAGALLEEVHADQRAWRQAAVDRWPLHSLIEEVQEATARDELAYLHGFTGSPRSLQPDCP
jgi:hypothetical protein